MAGVGDTDNAQFSISGSTLSITAGGVFDYEVKNSYSIRVQTQNSGTSTVYTKVFTIAVNDLDDPHRVTFTNTKVPENVAPQIIGQASTQGGSGPYTYAMQAGNGDSDNGEFTITSGGELSLSNAADYETKKFYSIRIRSTDSSTSHYFDQIVIIDVTDVSEPSNILLSRTNLNENTANAAVGTASSVGGFSPFVFALAAGTGDTDNASFTIDASTGALALSGLASQASQATYSIRLSVTDANTKSFAK